MQNVENLNPVVTLSIASKKRCNQAVNRRRNNEFDTVSKHCLVFYRFSDINKEN